MKLLILETKDNAIFNYYKQVLTEYKFDYDEESIIYEPNRIFYQTKTNRELDDINESLQVFEHIHDTYFATYSLNTQYEWQTRNPIHDVCIYFYSDIVDESISVSYTYYNAMLNIATAEDVSIPFETKL